MISSDSNLWFSKVVKYPQEYNLFRNLINTYLILSGFGLLYYFIGVPKEARTTSDIINIFMWAATLLGPIALVFTLNGWREQHNKNLSKEVALVCWDTVTLNINLLEEYVIKARTLESYTETIGFIEEIHGELREEMNKIKDNYYKSNQDALVQVAKVKALCSNSLDMDNYMKTINETIVDLSEMRSSRLFHTERSDQVVLKMNISASTLLNQLEKIIKA